MKIHPNDVDGKFVEGKSRFADVNPATGAVIAEVAAADKEQVDQPVQSARRGLRGEWGRWSVRDRATHLHQVADAIEKRFDCSVAAEVADTGKPVDSRFPVRRPTAD